MSLNYNSNHPAQHKISRVKTIFNRVNTHYNNEQSKQDERKYLYPTFYKNGYPLRIINKVLAHKERNNMDQPNPALKFS